MVSGGKGKEGKLDSVELLNMNGTGICSMPPLPEARYDHSQTGPVICGGEAWKSSLACITFSTDWKKTHTLAGPKGMGDRKEHVAWASPRGVMLIGGSDPDSERTSEILTEDGHTTPGFTLDYRTMCVRYSGDVNIIFHSFVLQRCLFYRGARDRNNNWGVELEKRRKEKDKSDPLLCGRSI